MKRNWVVKETFPQVVLINFDYITIYKPYIDFEHHIIESPVEIQTGASPNKF